MMFALLNPRVWIALALVAFLGFTHFTAYRAGKGVIRAEWTLSIAQANNEARALERRRQDRADEAGRLAATRANRLAADARSAGGALDRLRSAIAARSVAEESASAATQRANTNGVLLIESSAAYRELAATCDRHTSDLRLLLDAWPR